MKRFKVVESAPSLGPSFEEAESIAEEMNPNFLACRDLRHNFTKTPKSTAYYLADGGIYRELECINCHSFRVDEFGPGSEGIVKSYIRYAEGYLLPAGTGRLSREAMSALRKANTRAQFGLPMLPKEEARRQGEALRAKRGTRFSHA